MGTATSTDGSTGADTIDWSQFDRIQVVDFPDDPDRFYVRLDMQASAHALRVCTDVAAEVNDAMVDLARLEQRRAPSKPHAHVMGVTISRTPLNV